MNVIPIVFAFDNNLILPACVCISSLMINAKEDTFYDIFILHSVREKLDKSMLDTLPQHYSNCKIQYRCVDGAFENAFEIRGITTPAYYRLLIPDLIPEYDKIIYSDVDVIFRMDLSELYQIDLKDYLLAATKDVGINLSKDGKKYITSVSGLVQGDYLQSGFIVMNTKKMRTENVVSQFRILSQQKYRFQDQDILNLVCKGRVLYVEPYYNMTDYSFDYFVRKPELLKYIYSVCDIEYGLQYGNIHYNGHKPWKEYSVNFDIWWEYYRNSPVFDHEFYFRFFCEKIELFDRLSFWKRIKILVRYFLHGRIK